MKATIPRTMRLMTGTLFILTAVWCGWLIATRIDSQLTLRTQDAQALERKYGATSYGAMDHWIFRGRSPNQGLVLTAGPWEEIRVYIYDGTNLLVVKLDKDRQRVVFSAFDPT